MKIRDHITLPRLVFVFIVMAALILWVLTRLAASPSFTLLAGPDGSSFYEDALRFKKILARDGVQVTIQKTRGTVDNLRLLVDAEAPTAAFADALGAVRDTEDTVLDGAGEEALAEAASSAEGGEVPSRLDQISSLGAIYMQPMWIFTRNDTSMAGLEELGGRRLGAGPPGSTSRMLAELILQQLDADLRVELVDIDGRDEKREAQEVLAALRAGEVDAAMAVGQPGNVLIQSLLRAEDMRVAAIRRAEAYALHFHFLAPVRLPEGGYDLVDNIPREEIRTLAASTELVVNADFPSPLADLLLQATAEVHGEASLFTERDVFPNPDMVSITLNASAARFYSNGPPLLRKYLPFQLATWIDRFIGLIVAFGSIAFGVFSVLPRLLEVHLERKLQAAHRTMEAIEKRHLADEDPQVLREELDALDAETGAIRILLKSSVASWLETRQVIHDLRERLT